MAVAMAAAARVATVTVWLAEGVAEWQLPPRPVLQLIFRRRAWLGLSLGRVGVRDRVGRMYGKERCVVARAGRGRRGRLGCYARVGGGLPTRCPPFCLVEGRRGGSRRKGAGKGPRPRPANIVKDRADSASILAQIIGCEVVVDLRPTRLLSARAQHIRICRDARDQNR
eukprot:scaffold94058_cov63-Phaeocystis_antarctica.AAC.1